MANEDEPKTENVEAPPDDVAASGAAATPTAEEALAKLKEEQDQLKDRLLRTAAEFENYKKRVKKELDEAQARGREALLKEILPVLDNLERALSHAQEKDPLAVGVRMVEKQLLSGLEKFGITRFSALGQPFDPSLHDAIQHVETSDIPPGSVATEFAKGYLSGGRLLRPAMVGVAKAPPAPQPSMPDGPEPERN
jgi:molecular chaperone GrpE